MQDAVDMAMDLISNGEYESAFHLLRQAAENTSLGSERRADAYQVMGALVQIVPQLGDGDESGLSFYKCALAIAPDHLWASIGVISTFGDLPYQHKDEAAFLAAEAVARRQWSQLDEAARTEVNQKRQEFNAGA
jgi:hypothetical protein